MIMDPIFFLLLIPGLLLGMYAQFRLTSTYNRYVRQGIASGMSGAQAAREILDRAGLHNMPVNMVRGHLTDHYDPMKKALFLSEENFHGQSIAAVGVAAHEAGHALQHHAAYAPLKLRMAMVPITSFASQAAMFLIFGQILLGIAGMAMLGVIIYGIVAAFQVITLPVEYDASRRAKQQLLSMGIVQREEAGAVGKVLNAAALTYVAAMVSSLLSFLYWFSILRGSDRD
ncbi:MAG: zinc metallopeptidase [Limisphaerales bacterium]